MTVRINNRSLFVEILEENGFIRNEKELFFHKEEYVNLSEINIKNEKILFVVKLLRIHYNEDNDIHFYSIQGFFTNHEEIESFNICLNIDGYFTDNFRIYIENISDIYRVLMMISYITIDKLKFINPSSKKSLELYTIFLLYSSPSDAYFAIKPATMPTNAKKIVGIGNIEIFLTTKDEDDNFYVSFNVFTNEGLIAHNMNEVNVKEFFGRSFAEIKRIVEENAI